MYSNLKHSLGARRLFPEVTKKPIIPVSSINLLETMTLAVVFPATWEHSLPETVGLSQDSQPVCPVSELVDWENILASLQKRR